MFRQRKSQAEPTLHHFTRTDGRYSEKDEDYSRKRTADLLAKVKPFSPEEKKEVDI
jgi:hypothetical protein